MNLVIADLARCHYFWKVDFCPTDYGRPFVSILFDDQRSGSKPVELV